MRDAHEWLEENGRKREAEAITKVLEFRLRAASAAYRVKIDLDNIEELFSLASAVDLGLSKTIQLAIAATIDYRIQTHKEPSVTFQAEDNAFQKPNQWRFDYQSKRMSAPLYEFYVNALIGGLSGKANPKSRNTFLTFNYDCLIEQSLQSLNIPFSYGFKSRTVNFDATSQHFHLTDPSDLKVLKLHGSVNWALPGKQGKKLTIYGSYSNLVEHNFFPELVAPTWRKTFGGNLNDIWDQAIKELATATRLIIVGFSMPQTDMHFKYLLAAGLEKNISLREIVFVNPDKQGIEERCELIFGEMMRESRKLKVVGKDVSSFVNQGVGNGLIADYGRELHSSIQSVYKITP